MDLLKSFLHAMNIRKPILEYVEAHQQENPYFANDNENFARLVELVRTCRQGFARSLTTKNKQLLKWIDDSLPELRDSFYSISTKCYWILKGLDEFPKCKHCGKSLDDKNVKLNFGYNAYCSVSCEVNDNKVLQKNVKNRWKKFHQQNIAFTKHEFEKKQYRLLVHWMLHYIDYYD